MWDITNYVPLMFTIDANQVVQIDLGVNDQLLDFVGRESFEDLVTTPKMKSWHPMFLNKRRPFASQVRYRLSLPVPEFNPRGVVPRNRIGPPPRLGGSPWLIACSPRQRFAIPPAR